MGAKRGPVSQLWQRSTTQNREVVGSTPTRATKHIAG